MPIDYTIAARNAQANAIPDFANTLAQYQMMGARAQQQDLAGFQAQIAAQRDLRQAQAAERQAGLYGAQQQEIEQKLQSGRIDIYKNMFDKFVNDQKSLDNFVSLMEKDFPQGVAAFKGKKYSDDWKQSLINPAGDYMEAGGEVYKKSARGLTPAPILPAEGMPSARQDLATNLIKEREGFIEKPKYDVNAYRAGYGSDTVTLPDGTVQKIEPGMRVSREDAERDLQRRIQTEFVPKAAAKVGEENWSRLPENTRAALTSVAYNYGNIPTRIVSAVKSGNPDAIARAIEGLADDNKGVNAGRRMQEANIARGTNMPGSQAVPAFAAAGAPTFMGGPQIQPPINMMGAAPVNAMAAPIPSPAPPPPVLPTQPITVGTRKQIKGQSNIDKTLDKMLGTYDQLLTSGDMISSQTATADPLGTLGRYLKGTTVGQETEKALGSKAQDKRNRISALRGQLLQDIKEATGQTSKELDSNFELKSALERLGDPTMSIESIRSIVSDLSSRYGSGKIKMPEESEVSKAAPSTDTGTKNITRRGTYNGRPVIQYSDGTIEYAN